MDITTGSVSFLKLMLFSSLNFFEIFESFSYFPIIALDKEIASGFLESSLTSSQSANKKSSFFLNSLILTIDFPSTRIFTVPSGNLSNWSISPKVP